MEQKKSPSNSWKEILTRCEKKNMGLKHRPISYEIKINRNEGLLKRRRSLYSLSSSKNINQTNLTAHHFHSCDWLETKYDMNKSNMAIPVTYQCLSKDCYFQTYHEEEVSEVFGSVKHKNYFLPQITHSMPRNASDLSRMSSHAKSTPKFKRTLSKNSDSKLRQMVTEHSSIDEEPNCTTPRATSIQLKVKSSPQFLQVLRDIKRSANISVQPWMMEHT